MLLATVPGGSLTVNESIVLKLLGSDSSTSSESSVVTSSVPHGGVSAIVNVAWTWLPGSVVCVGGVRVKTTGGGGAVTRTVPVRLIR
jgi:hypothetical protein